MIFFFCTVLEVCKDVLCGCLCTTVWEDKLKSELEHRVPLPGRRPVWIAVPLLVHGFFLLRFELKRYRKQIPTPIFCCLGVVLY